MYVAIRGWLELDPAHLQTATKIIAADPRGWAHTPHPAAWTPYLHFGADLREPEVPTLRNHITTIAHLPPTNDGDHPTGFFLLTDERQQSWSWTVRNGTLQETPAPPELRWFAQQP